MTQEFKYLKEGLSVDLIEFLIRDYNIDVREAFDILYESDTYSKICEPLTGLYYQGSRYVYTYLQKELQTGTMS